MGQLRCDIPRLTRAGAWQAGGHGCGGGRWQRSGRRIMQRRQHAAGAACWCACVGGAAEIFLRVGEPWPVWGCGFGSMVALRSYFCVLESPLSAAL